MPRYQDMTDDEQLRWALVCALIRKRFKSVAKYTWAMAWAAHVVQGKPEPNLEALDHLTAPERARTVKEIKAHLEKLQVRAEKTFPNNQGRHQHL